jgi:RHS repeat-associated protein
LEVTYHGTATTNAFVAFDGNGNVTALVNAGDGTVLGNYEYGPFGEVIRNSGPLARNVPFRFSTKYQDDESDLVYYGYRYYKASTGTWPNRDPINEAGFNLVSGRKGKFVLEEEKNLYGFLDNDPLGDYDINGLNGAAIAGECVGGIALLPAEIPVGAIIVGTVVVAGTVAIVWKLCKCKQPKGCLPCNPVAGTLLYEIAPGNSRQRGRHVGIDHVKYWKMNQVPYMNPGPNDICHCYWRFDHTDDNTLIPVPGAIPGGPPDVVAGPSLGGGIAY